jgi:hypothetical protein
LPEAVAQYGRNAYLLTIANDGPHTSFVSVDLKGNVIACAIGKSAARNIASVPNVSLFWPPREPGGYALVVNGAATGRREPSGVTRAEIALTKSVLHRAGPKPSDSDGPCPSDCRLIASRHSHPLSAMSASDRHGTPTLTCLGLSEASRRPPAGTDLGRLRQDGGVRPT